MSEVYMKKIILLLSCLALAACQYVPPRDISSPFFSPPAGSTLRLTRQLTIPANDAGVMIQYGQPQYSSWKLDQYYPHCDFELRTRAPRQQVVEPDTFTVTRTVREIENVLLAPAMLASSASAAATISSGGRREAARLASSMISRKCFRSLSSSSNEIRSGKPMLRQVEQRRLS